MRSPTARPKPRKAQLASFPVPTAGQISNRNIATPTGEGAPPGAAMLVNWFPTPSTTILRRGIKRWATLPAAKTVKSVFSYIIGDQKDLFASTDDGVWNVTTVPDPANPGTSVLSGMTDGDWVTVQFSTAGGTFLIGVNGKDVAFLYNGTTFTTTAITFPGGSSLTTADLSYVWAYKQRIWFIEKDSLNAWYLPVDSIAGELKLLPLGGVFSRGGSLLWGQTWSLDSGGDGGLSEQNVFTTTEGEVAAYQGLSPDDAASWGKVGVYRVGRPLGKKAFIRAGGDLVIATSIGFIPLGQAIKRDYAALGLVAVSQPIADDWRIAVSDRGFDDWTCELWGEGSMTLIAPPTPDSRDPIVFVVNSDSGAWSTFTGWQATSMESFNGRIFIGSTAGKVQEAWVGGNDEGLPYTASMMPLFNDLGSPGQRKYAAFARVVKRSSFLANETIAARFDWNMALPAPPDAILISGASVWDAGVWDVSVWDTERGTTVTEQWMSVGGSGYAASVVVQVTSASAAPLDVEIIRIDFTYSIGDIIT